MTWHQAGPAHPAPGPRTMPEAADVAGAGRLQRLLCVQDSKAG